MNQMKNPVASEDLIADVDAVLHGTDHFEFEDLPGDRIRITASFDPPGHVEAVEFALIVDKQDIDPEDGLARQTCELGRRVRRARAHLFLDKIDRYRAVELFA